MISKGDEVRAKLERSWVFWLIWVERDPSMLVEKVMSLSAEIDTTPYETNAHDLGLREDAEDDGLAYWTEVYAQAVADALP